MRKYNLITTFILTSSVITGCNIDSKKYMNTNTVNDNNGNHSTSISNNSAQQLTLHPIELVSVDEIKSDSFKIQWIPNVLNERIIKKPRYVIEVYDKKEILDRYLVRLKQNFYSFPYNKSIISKSIQKFYVKIRVISSKTETEDFLVSDWSKEIEVSKPARL